MQEMAYQTAMVKLSGSDYESAIAWYEKAGDYNDAKEQILSIGEYYYATRQYDLAEDVYVKVLGTGVAAQRLYELGQHYEQAGDNEHASQCYREAGDYQDAQDKVIALQNELDYQAAEALYAAQDWEGAKVAYAKIPGYKDVDTKIEACDNAIEAAVAAAREPFTKVGNIVTYGHYEQDNNTSNGKEAIEWQVLAVDGDKILVISRYGLDAQPYNTKDTSVTWETCSLRSWLNGSFLFDAFDIEERQSICTTIVDNSSDQSYASWWPSSANNT